MDIFHAQHPEFDPSTTLPPHLVDITSFVDYAVDSAGRPAIRIINPPTGQVPLQQRTHYGFLPVGPPPTSQQQQQQQQPRHQGQPLQLAHHRQQQQGQQVQQPYHHQTQHQHLYEHHHSQHLSMSLPLHQHPLQPHHTLKHQQLHHPQPRQYHQAQHQLTHLSIAAHQRSTVSPRPFYSAPSPNPQLLFPGIMAESNPHDMAAQQEAAKEYQPVHEVKLPFILR